MRDEEDLGPGWRNGRYARHWPADCRLSAQPSCTRGTLSRLATAQSCAITAHIMPCAATGGGIQLSSRLAATCTVGVAPQSQYRSISKQNEAPSRTIPLTGPIDGAAHPPWLLRASMLAPSFQSINSRETGGAFRLITPCSASKAPRWVTRSFSDTMCTHNISHPNGYRPVPHVLDIDDSKPNPASNLPPLRQTVGFRRSPARWR